VGVRRTHMARLGVSKKKKSPRATELSQLKKEVQRLTEQLESCQRELESSNTELRETREQQTTTGEILRVIASSPTDLQPVFQTILDNAVRLCEAQNGAVFRFDGEFFRAVVWNNTSPAFSAFEQNTPIPPGRESALRRVGLEKRPVHIPDMLADSECIVPQPYREEGIRTNLGVPLLKETELIGAIAIHRREVRPFTENQIKLLETFADQAVIAIENVRLFKELQTRNRDLTTALDRQTATADVLRIIAQSPTELQPVLDAIATSAVRLCAASDAVIERLEGDRLYNAAHEGSQMKGLVGLPLPLTRQFPGGRAILDRKPVILDDIHLVAQSEYPDTLELLKLNTIHSVAEIPLLSEGKPLGSLAVLRAEVHPFTEAEVALLNTFADQAVIAIENVRLFKELQDRNRQLTEALEQQTATSEILRVIANSPTDIQPVLDVVAENAARLCEANDAQICRLDGDVLRRVAVYGEIPAGQIGEERAVDRGWLGGRAVLNRQAIHVHDLEAESEAEFPLAKAYQKRVGARTRTVVHMPLLREGVPIGTIAIRRTEVKPFSDKQLALLKTFSDQAVIAIENVRLFQELQARTRELARSVEELKALGEVGQAVSSTLELQTVLSTIIGHAVQLSGTDGGVIYEYDEAAEGFLLRASYRMEEVLVEALRAAPIRLGEGTTGRGATIRAPVQVPDILRDREYTGTLERT